MRKFGWVSAFKWLLALSTIICVFSASAREPTIDRAYWQDESAQATYEQAQTQIYQTYDGVLSRGYTAAAIWIRLRVMPPVGSETLVLRVGPVYLDEIQLFDPLFDKGLPRKTGDTAHFENNEFKSLAHTFVIPAGQEPRTVWLRVRTNSTTLIGVDAFTPQGMAEREFHAQLGYFAVLALVAMFMIVVFISWLNDRDALSGFFVVRQLYYLFYTASLFGLHRYALAGVADPAALDMLYSWMVVGATAMSFGFEYKFLNEYSPPPWVRVVMKGLLAWSAVVVGLLLTGHVLQALKFNMLLNTVGVITLLVMSLIFIEDGQSTARSTAALLRKKFVVGYYLIVNLVLVFSLMPYLGWMQGNEFAVNGLVFYTVCSGLAMTVLMQLRAQQIRKAQSAFEQEWLISQRQVALEKSRREEQTHLFHMLMHELKNPLAIIDMALLAKNDSEKTHAYINRSVAQIKNILERCVRADQLTEGHVVIDQQPVVLNRFLCDMLRADHRLDQKLVLSLDESLRVNTDPQLLEVMLGNLMDNAVRYGDPLMPVQIQAQARPNPAGAAGVCVTVSNHPGPAAWPDGSKVFKKYYRSPGAESQSGTGLGLYLVRTLASLVGGECRYAPDTSHIRFELWLPS
jgi:two-component system, sensor histidine kinase LadS